MTYFKKTIAVASAALILSTGAGAAQSLGFGASSPTPLTGSVQSIVFNCTIERIVRGNIPYITGIRLTRVAGPTDAGTQVRVFAPDFGPAQTVTLPALASGQSHRIEGLLPVGGPDDATCSARIAR